MISLWNRSSDQLPVVWCCAYCR